MSCGLRKYYKDVPEYWVSKNGELYPYWSNKNPNLLKKDKYINSGYGKEWKGFKDLPSDGYPYTIKYKRVYMWGCCNLGTCGK